MEKNMAKKIRVVGSVLLVLYLLGLIYFLFFAENYGRTISREEYQYNLRPFKEIMRFIKYREELGMLAFASNIFGNVLGFIPLGLIFPIINKKARNFFFIAMISFEFSLLIETVQLVFKVGSFDVDDLILNTLGGMLGYLLFYICNKIRRKYYD
jgi:Glycopeptide antibiotics resistance protein